MSVAKAADGIFQVINANMAAALNVVSVQRGYDPREFVLIVAGGAGPFMRRRSPGTSRSRWC